jgi:hypothetical protein
LGRAIRNNPVIRILLQIRACFGCIKGERLKWEEHGGQETSRVFARIDLFARKIIKPRHLREKSGMFCLRRMLFNTYRAFLPVGCGWVYSSVAAPFGAALMMTCTVRDFIEDTFELADVTSVAPKSSAGIGKFLGALFCSLLGRC